MCVCMYVCNSTCMSVGMYVCVHSCIHLFMMEGMQDTVCKHASMYVPAYRYADTCIHT